MENALATDKGEYDSEYTINAGSYYDKAWAPMLMTESVDNFISDSRRDFLDGRYRAVSMADLFPDGFRRWMGNNLTGDTALKGGRLAAQGGMPTLDGELPRRRHRLHLVVEAQPRDLLPGRVVPQLRRDPGQQPGDRPADRVGAAEVPDRDDPDVPA